MEKNIIVDKIIEILHSRKVDFDTARGILMFANEGNGLDKLLNWLEEHEDAKQEDIVPIAVAIVKGEM